MNNLPPDVMENSYGAPWNDQEYVAEFRFEFNCNEDITFSSNLQNYYFNLAGPYNYDCAELQNAALESIKDAYCAIISEYGCTIDIENIYAE